MGSLKCVRCLGSGWVCEDHLDRPSDVTSEGGCDCGGAAAPCKCNPGAHYEFDFVFASVDEAPKAATLH